MKDITVLNYRSQTDSLIPSQGISSFCFCGYFKKIHCSEFLWTQITHLCWASHKWNIGKQCRASAERGIGSIITETSLFKYIENFTSKNGKSSDKNSDISHISAQNIDFGYSLVVLTSTTIYVFEQK